MNFLNYLFFLFLFAGLATGCETNRFDKDKRQIAAKNAVRSMLRNVRNFDVLGFKEDTLASWTDSTMQHPIRYTLQVSYTDSAGQPQARNAAVLFTPDGKSLLTTQIQVPAQ